MSGAGAGGRAPAGAVLVAAGGTGGHMFPALAVADELRARGVEVALLTDARGARYAGGRPHRVVSAGSPTGSPRQAALGAALLARGAVEATFGLGRRRPAAAALFGGYASVPAALAAWLRGTPALVHEQNAVFGKANRLAARAARAVAVSFEGTRALPPGAVPILTGNPVRPGFAAVPGGPRDGRFRVLVLGGSQGARVFSDVVPAAVALLPEPLRARLEVAQQCRPEDLERVRAAYAGVPFAAELAGFFDDVPRRMAAADLLICRSGASTIAELLALAKPAILVPYPHAADDHQRANAEAVAAAGAGLCLPQPEAAPGRLAALLAGLAGEPARLEGFAAAARRAARPDAAARLADAVLALAPAPAATAEPAPAGEPA